MRKLHLPILATLWTFLTLLTCNVDSLAHSIPHINDVLTNNVSSNPDNLPRSIRKIVIDAGHGGRDHGCAVDHTQEKKINLHVAKLLGDMLNKAYPTLEVIYTRTSDRFVSLDERAIMANEGFADLFISIHCNYVKETEVSGAETYILGSHKDSHHALHGHYLESDSKHEQLVIDNYLQAKSIDIAEAIVKSFDKIKGHKNRGIKRAAFTVLKETTMPSVLVEMGFLSNPEDNAMLTSDKGQSSMASSLFEACLDYFETLRQRENISYQPQVVKYQKVAAQKQIHISTINPKKTYKVQFAEFTDYPQIDGSEKWQDLGLIEIKQIDDRFLFLTQAYDTMDAAINQKTFLENKGFKGAYIVADP